MLEKLRKIAEKLKIQENEIESKLRKKFDDDSVFIGCGMMDSMEGLIIVKAKLELLVDIIEIIIDEIEKDNH